MSKTGKCVFMFIFGFMAYITIECLFRGYSFPAMGLCGGIVFVLLDKINDKISWDIDILVQGMMGSVLITFLEFIIGEMSLRGLIQPMWNYTNLPLNYKGIICLPFSLIWIVLSIVAIVVADWLNYYIFNDETIPYYKLFGKVIYRFKVK